MALLFDVIVDLPEGITVVPVFAADKAEALEAGKELFPGHRVTVVLKEASLRPSALSIYPLRSPQAGLRHDAATTPLL